MDRRGDAGPAGGLTRVVVGLGAVAGAMPGTDLVVDVGGQHPSTHGALRVVLDLDGDTVVRAEPLLGHLHRGAEKLFEVRDYRQALVLANRHDWLSSSANEIGLALAVERLLGLELPPRAVWLRTVFAEVTRVLAHLAFLGSPPLEVGTLPPGHAATREREALQAVLEEATGGRVHPMVNRVGGLVQDVPAGWTGRLRAAVAATREALPGLAAALLDDPGFRARTQGVGVLDPGLALSCGATGPVARASGVDLDLRRDDPYLAYGDLGVGGDRFPVVVRTAGDCFARWACLVEQVGVSLDLVEACLDRLPGGPVAVRLPKTVKAPEGDVYVWTENPLGIQGYYLVSRGERTPHRLAMRTASFGNLAVLPHLLPGTRLADLVAVLGSLFYVVGDVDK